MHCIPELQKIIASVDVNCYTPQFQNEAAGDDKITADLLKSCHDNVISLIMKKPNQSSKLDFVAPSLRSTTSTRPLEVGREYQIPLTLVFMDFHKAFDSVEPGAIWESLRRQGIDSAYINLLKECYTNCSTTFTPFHRLVTVPITRGVRQGDPISPNLFSACLELVFSQMSWNHLKGHDEDHATNPGIRINGRNLTRLRFADDIVLAANHPNTVSEMIQELVERCAKIGLQINTNKTKVLRNTFATDHPVCIKSRATTTTAIEDVNEYIYFGRLLNTRNELEPELHRRRRAAWAAFNGIKNTTDALTCPKIRARLFDSIVLPALAYGSETWTFTKALAERVRLGWAGHVARRTDNRWTTLTQEWIPRDTKRPVGRPPMRWIDALNKEVTIRQGSRVVPWSTIAKDRKAWCAVIRVHTT
ncbi:unnamed protein product [Caenorhabditis sp. 36 PRJEB53466]|nr:unnamed protein product [Caenorhabditis sp. 36 PRJEB53466]